MVYPLFEAKEEILNLLNDVLTKLKFDGKVKLSPSPKKFGDFAFPCFPLATITKQSPKKIAEDIAGKIKKRIMICST